MLCAYLLVICAHLGHVRSAAFGGEQALHRGDAARGVRDIYHRAGIVRRDLDRGVGARGGGTADQQRHVESVTLHFARHVRHFLERRRDQTRQPDGIGLLPLRGVDDGLRGDHHAEVEDLVVVALQDDRDDVLADVVHVALYRRHDHAPFGTRDLPGSGLLGFDVRDEVAHSLLHDARRFHHLRQEHLACAEQVADDVHAVHQRSLDDFDRPGKLQAGLFGVGYDVGSDAVHQGMRESLLGRAGAPGLVLYRLARATFDSVRELYEALGRVASPIEDDVFYALAQLGGDFLVDPELPGVDDAHRHPGAYRVIQERRVHRFAYRVVAAEREREVGHAARYLGVRQVGAYPANRLQVLKPVAGVFL